MTSPPARYSIGQEDFNPEVGMALAITFNGKLQDNVIEYDCDAGTLTRYITDDKGLIVIDRIAEEAVRETVSGSVEVRWREGVGQSL